MVTFGILCKSILSRTILLPVRQFVDAVNFCASAIVDWPEEYVFYRSVRLLDDILQTNEPILPLKNDVGHEMINFWSQEVRKKVISVMRPMLHWKSGGGIILESRPTWVD